MLNDKKYRIRKNLENHIDHKSRSISIVVVAIFSVAVVVVKKLGLKLCKLSLFEHGFNYVNPFLLDDTTCREI